MKYLILGAGPAGLSFSYQLKLLNQSSFLILEKESTAGGLCRSANVDGFPLDIGGGHFLDAGNQVAVDFLFRFMPQNEWNLFDRDSRISLDHQLIHHPLEANIWEFDIENQIKYLKSIANAGCNHGTPMPSKFIDWVTWKLGDKIADEYMIPYNRKMFGSNLNVLGTYWLSKLPNVSFDDTLRSCLTKHAYGKQPGHARFYYPKNYGYGEVWLRMAAELNNNIEYNKEVRAINAATRTVTTSDGETYKADIIITTIPWREFQVFNGIPESIHSSIRELRHTAIQTAYHPDMLETPAHWIYYPEPHLSYHRILVRHNFCPNSIGYWTETNADRINPDRNSNNFSYINKYAYPLNTIDKPAIMTNLSEWAKGNKIYGLGRWGEHQHLNSDIVVEQAIDLAKALA